MAQIRKGAFIKASLVLLALVVAIVVGSKGWTDVPRDPTYKGRRLSAWLNDMGHGSGTFALTRDDFKAMGPDGVNRLAWAAEHGHVPPIRDQYARRSPTALAVHELWRMLAPRRVDEEFNERMAALMILGRLGPDAAPAEPALKRLLNDPNQRIVSWARSALENIERSREP